MRTISYTSCLWAGFTLGKLGLPGEIEGTFGSVGLQAPSSNEIKAAATGRCGRTVARMAANSTGGRSLPLTLGLVTEQSLDLVFVEQLRDRGIFE